MVEINKGNIGEYSRFSANGRVKQVDSIELGKDLKPQDFVNEIIKCSTEGISVRSDVVNRALDQLPFTYQQAKIITDACSEGLMRVKEKDADKYRVKLPEMNQYRWVRRKATEIFDREVNK